MSFLVYYVLGVLAESDSRRDKRSDGARRFGTSGCDPLPWSGIGRRVVLGILLVGLTSSVSPPERAMRRWTAWPISGTVRESSSEQRCGVAGVGLLGA